VSSFSGSEAESDKLLVKENSILYIDLRHRFRELDESNSVALFSDRSEQPSSAYDLIRSINYAKKDDKIKGIYIRTGGSPNGLATLQQVRNALKDFKQSRKFIYAYGDYIPQSDYFVASVADSVFINPLGIVEVKGLATNLAFFKGTLDKLNIQPEIFYNGQFKSATEPFRLQKMSDPSRLQLASFQKTIWQEMLVAASEHTKADTATINAWAQNGTIQTAQDAVRYKLADGLRYKDQIEQLMKSKTGLAATEKVKLVSVATYRGSIPATIAENQIALLVAEGEIVDGEAGDYSNQIASETFIKEIRKISDNDAVKAVVLRVNSPGGSALASEVILRELQLLHRKKPLVVSMGNVAASGGYYISCASDSIFVLPTTITGSIGVFGMMFNTEDFFNEKLGVTFDTEKNAPYADFPNVTRPLTEMERRFIQQSVDTIYATFKNRVATGRKLDLSVVDSIAQGRIWSGTAAIENGLADKIGGLDRALESAAALAKLEDYKLVRYPAPADKFEKILRMVASSTSGEKVTVAGMLEKELGKEYPWFRTLRSMRDQKNKIWMMMPYSIEIQ
ncbi:MAG: signal peptide peptidase SppA, partial [Chitinophagaceae bacterium]|nr:signal peptide peptidase SppA [Chitinophagaceae bacterium]